MHQFAYRSGHLLCEKVELATVAGQCGTPVYVYSASTIEDNYRRLDQGFEGLDLQICYALKANSNLSIVHLLRKLGSGFDVVSGGEIHRVLAAGGDLRRSVFAGVGKTTEEIELALQNDIFSVHVESEPELNRLNAIAGRLGRRAPVAIRVNPDVDAKTHAKITTGKGENKFGIPLATALDAYNYTRTLPNIEIRGVQIHIGSQIVEVEPFVAAVRKMVPLIKRLKEKYSISYFSIGGGIGIVYENALASGDPDWWKRDDGGRNLLTPKSYGRALRPLLEPLELKILLEPGRFMLGNAGVLLTRVEYVKRGHRRSFVVLDAAMNDLPRPAIYDAFHEIVPVRLDPHAGRFTTDIVGPVCETSDCFARQREIQRVGEGDLLAILSSGAYGFVMASRYNTRPLPAEVLVQGEEFDVVTRRESFDQLIANERLPKFLQD